MDVHCLETELDVNIFFPSNCKILQTDNEKFSAVDCTEKQNIVLQALETFFKTTNLSNNVPIVAWKLAGKLENVVLSSHTKKRNVACQQSVIVPLCMTPEVFVRLLNCIMTTVTTTQNKQLAEKMTKLCTSLLLSHKEFPKSTLLWDNIDVKKENISIVSEIDIKRQQLSIKQYKYSQTLLGILMAKSILTHCLTQTPSGTTIHESELVYLLSIITSLLSVERNIEHIVEILDLLVCCANRMVNSFNESEINNSNALSQTQNRPTICDETTQSIDRAIAHILSKYNNHIIYNHFNCLPSFLVDTTVPTSNNNFYNATNKVLPAPRVSNSNDFVWEVAGIADIMMSIVVDQNMVAKLKCKEINSIIEMFSKTSYLHTLHKLSTSNSISSGINSGNNDHALFRISIPNSTANQTNSSTATTNNNSHYSNNDIVLSHLILYHYTASSTDALVHEDSNKNMDEEEECVTQTDIDILMRLALECTMVVAILAAQLQATATTTAKVNTVIINSNTGTTESNPANRNNEKRFELSLLFIRILCQVNNSRHYLRLMTAHNSLEYVPHYAHILKTLDTQLNNMLSSIDYSIVCETLVFLLDKHNVFTNSDAQPEHTRHGNPHTTELEYEQEYNSRDGILSHVPSGLLTDAGLCVVSQFVARYIENRLYIGNSSDVICKLLCFLPLLLQLTADCDVKNGNSSGDSSGCSGNSAASSINRTEWSGGGTGINSNSVQMTVFTDVTGNSLAHNLTVLKLLMMGLLQLFRIAIDGVTTRNHDDNNSIDSSCALINRIAGEMTNSVDNTNNSVKLYNMLQHLIVKQSDSFIIAAIVSVLNALINYTQVTNVRTNTINSTENSGCEYSLIHSKHVSLIWRLINTSSTIVSSNIVFRSVYEVGTDRVVNHVVSHGHYNIMLDSLVRNLQILNSGDSDIQVANTLQLLTKLFKTDTLDECNNDNSNNIGNIDITMLLWLSFIAQNNTTDTIYVLSYIIKQVFNFLYRVKIKQQLLNHETMSAIHELQSNKPLTQHHTSENETTDQLGIFHSHKSPNKLSISPALSPYNTVLNTQNTLNIFKSPQETPPKRIKSHESKQFSYVNDVADKYAQKIGVKIADELPPQNSITNNPAALALLLSQIGAKPLNTGGNSGNNGISKNNISTVNRNNNRVNSSSSSNSTSNAHQNTPGKHNSKSNSNSASNTPINTTNTISTPNSAPRITTNITINTPTQFGNSERRVAAVINSVEQRIIQNNKRKITSPTADQFHLPFNNTNNSTNSLNIPAIETTSSTYRLQTEKNLQFSPIYDKKSRDFYFEFCLSLLPAMCLLALSDIINEINTGDSNNDDDNNDELVSCNGSCSGSSSSGSSSSGSSDRNSSRINQKVATSGKVINLTDSNNNSNNGHTNNNYNITKSRNRIIFHTTSRFHSIISVYSILIYTLNEQIYIIQNNRKLHSFVVSILSETVNCCFAMLESVCLYYTVSETQNRIEKNRNDKNSNSNSGSSNNNTSSNTDIVLNNNKVSLINWSLTLLDAINRYCAMFAAVIVQCDVFTVTKAQITAVSKLEKESKLQFDSICGRFHQSCNKQQQQQQQQQQQRHNSKQNNSTIGIIRNATSNYIKHHQLNGGSVSTSPKTAAPHNTNNNNSNNNYSSTSNMNNFPDIPSLWDDNLVGHYIKCVEKLVSSEKLVSGNIITSDQCRNSEVNCSDNNSVVKGHRDINHNINNSTSSSCPSLIANKAPTPPVYCELLSDNSSLTDTASFTDLSLATDSNLNSAFESEHKYW